MNSANRHTETLTPFGDDRQVIAYFLGELPVEEQTRLEEACFNDEQFAEFIFTVESELIDEYARGGLTATERQHFEQNYLINDQRLERVKFAVHLQRQFKPAPVPAPQPQSPNRRWWQKLFASDGSRSLQWAVAVLALFFFGGLIARQFIEPAPDPNIIAQVSPTPSAVPTASPTALPPASPSPTASNDPGPVFAAITLLAGSVRDPGQPMPVLKLPGEATAAELRLRPDGDTFPRYRAELKTRAGILWQADNLKANQTGISIRISVNRLKDGDYTLLLYGRDEKGEAAPSDYNFRVIRN
jgi:hypothetical protein